MKRQSMIRSLCVSAMVAALYTALTLLFQPLSFQAVQFRVSEALTLIPVLFVEAVPGLTIGCLLSNLLAGANPYDVIFGTLATLLAALVTRKLRKNVWLAALPPVVFNGVIIGLVLTYAYGIDALALNMLTVSLGQAVVCYALGVPMVKGLQKLDVTKRLGGH
ncbi:MAG: QueT transporter family protein [Clostridiales bacterium]|nr:QueT transporter family protein [Clostridiales bacterium]